MQVGYYHILAADMNEAIEIAKGNPEFEKTARIEVRPVRMKEEKTGFVYPGENLKLIIHKEQASFFNFRIWEFYE